MKTYEVTIMQSVDASKLESKSLDEWSNELLEDGQRPFESYEAVAKFMAFDYVSVGNFSDYMRGGTEVEAEYQGE